MDHLSQKDAEEFIRLRAPEWVEFQRDWRWLQDSLEGGNRYRHANYQDDPQGNAASPHGLSVAEEDARVAVGTHVYGSGRTDYIRHVDRNLIPHVSETSLDGVDVYMMRLARTPVPRIVSRSVSRHLSRVYSHEVARDGPQALLDWWLDVDGAGTKIDKWMRKTIAPLFLVLGQLDLCFDHPAAPEDAVIETAADARAYGLGRCVASYILPENMLWWRVDPQTREYEECLVFERCPEGNRFRHWTDMGSACYDPEGYFLPDVSRVHPFGRVPIVRIFDQRKFRCSNVGQSRYESIADLQKAVYNARSELILGDVQQSHAILQGPEQFVRGDGAIEVGPRNVLPIFDNPTSNNVVAWQFLDPPKGAQAEVRTHIQDFMDEADRDASLLKPAGATHHGTVAQSGISKQMDMQEQDDTLSEVAETLADAELAVARMVLVVTSDGRATADDMAAAEVIYPKEFGLTSVGDLLAGLVEIQGIAAAQSDLPETMAEGLSRLVGTMYPGLSDERLAELQAEIREFVDKKASESAATSESLAASIGNPKPIVTPATGPGPASGAGDFQPAEPVNMTNA